jgi:hypothetical protein
MVFGLASRESPDKTHRMAADWAWQMVSGLVSLIL